MNASENALFNGYFSLTERVTAGVQDSYCNSANAPFRSLKKELLIFLNKRRKKEKKKISRVAGATVNTKKSSLFSFAQCSTVSSVKLAWQKQF